MFLQLSKRNHFESKPNWYNNIEYILERERGYDYQEDLFVPGYFEFDIEKGESVIFSAGLTEADPSTRQRAFEKELGAEIRK